MKKLDKEHPSLRELIQSVEKAQRRALLPLKSRRLVIEGVLKRWTPSKKLEDILSVCVDEDNVIIIYKNPDFDASDWESRRVEAMVISWEEIEAEVPKIIEAHAKRLSTLKDELADLEELSKTAPINFISKPNK